MKEFLKSYTNYEDIPVKEPYPRLGYTVICPRCDGHGAYNLKLNAYGPGQHFKGGCQQCNGWGWVTPENATCVHDWKQTAHDGRRCLTDYQCSKCGKTKTVDSSG